MQLRVSPLIHIRDASDEVLCMVGIDLFQIKIFNSKKRIETKRNADFILHVCFARSLSHLLRVLEVNITG